MARSPFRVSPASSLESWERARLFDSHGQGPAIHAHPRHRMTGGRSDTGNMTARIAIATALLTLAGPALADDDMGPVTTPEAQSAAKKVEKVNRLNKLPAMRSITLGAGLHGSYGETAPWVETEGAIAMFSLVLYPYVYLLARAAFIEQSICVLEASRVLGCTPWQSFSKVALPLARPAIVAGLVAPA